MKKDSSYYRLAGARLKALRRSKGWTQKEVAKKLDITEGFLSFLESGTKQGSLDTYIGLSKLYGRPLHELFLPDGKVTLKVAPGISLEGIHKSHATLLRRTAAVMRLAAER
jgi:putative transcriptional regulator